MGSDVATISPAEGFSLSKSSFNFSFSFLPKEQREALKTVYAFCRTTDDIVDNSGDVQTNIERLRRWRTELEKALAGMSEYSLLNQLSAVAKRFHIPVDHFYELVRGVEMDLTKNRYESFDELKEYCYLVASTVGLMSLGVFGPRNDRTKEYAINLGIALQLTNILRDVTVDAKYGRIYLPLEDMRRFGYTEGDLYAHKYSPQFLALMEFEAQRAEEFFRKAQAALPAEDKRVMFAAKIMERIYYHTLEKIRNERYNVFQKSIRLTRFIQFLIAVKYWVKQRLFGL